MYLMKALILLYEYLTSLSKVLMKTLIILYYIAKKLWSKTGQLLDLMLNRSTINIHNIELLYYEAKTTHYIGAFNQNYGSVNG